MDDSNKPDFAKVLISLGATLGVKPDKPQLRGYWMALNDLSMEQLSKACEMALKSSTNTYGQLPLPAILRSYVCEQPERRAELAWQAVLRAVERYGTYKGVDFDDRRTNAAVRAIGGWRELGACKADALDWRRREFVAAYVAGYKTPIHDELMLPLPGHGPDTVHVETGLSGAEPPRELAAGSDRCKALVAKIATTLTPPGAAGGGNA